MSCVKCPELRHCVPPVGPTTADLFIIGQSPGENEADRGMPFVGPAGKVLNQLLEAAEIARDDCFISNAVKCHPPRNRPSTATEISNCRHHLVRELKYVRPRAVLCLGKDAWRVFEQRVPWGHGVQIMATVPRLLLSYHPAYWLRQGNADGFIALAPKLKEILS